MSEELVRDILKTIGEDPDREGLLDTPKRVVKSWETLFGGYNQRPEDVLKTTFTIDCDEMVICKDIEFYSTCEHHMLPFFGKCHIGYIPKSKVVGLSKLARLLEIYSRRLQIQEQLTNQIADSLMNVLKPIGVGVIIEAKHFCMMCRGINKKNSSMITSAIRGIFQNSTVKNEFHTLIK
jgi:GTP cyclohydrolase I